ncbi:hypothetical protein ABZ806_43720 [Spirillospora sp. NPDC047418]
MSVVPPGDFRPTFATNRPDEQTVADAINALLHGMRISLGLSPGGGSRVTV